MGKLVSWFFTKPSVEILRQCSHFPAGESTSRASWLEVCALSLLVVQSRGPSFTPGLLSSWEPHALPPGLPLQS